MRTSSVLGASGRADSSGGTSSAAWKKLARGTENGARSSISRFWSCAENSPGSASVLAATNTLTERAAHPTRPSFDRCRTSPG